MRMSHVAKNILTAIRSFIVETKLLDDSFLPHRERERGSGDAANGFINSVHPINKCERISLFERCGGQQTNNQVGLFDGIDDSSKNLGTIVERLLFVA